MGGTLLFHFKTRSLRAAMFGAAIRSARQRNATFWNPRNPLIFRLKQSGANFIRNLSALA
jgi:hypothetical protein